MRLGWGTVAMIQIIQNYYHSQNRHHGRCQVPLPMPPLLLLLRPPTLIKAATPTASTTAWRLLPRTAYDYVYYVYYVRGNPNLDKTPRGGGTPYVWIQPGGATQNLDSVRGNHPTFGIWAGRPEPYPNFRDLLLPAPCSLLPPGVTPATTCYYLPRPAPYLLPAAYILLLHTIQEA